MPIAVTRHTCNIIPSSVDFRIFRHYLAGLAADEVVDLLLKEDSEEAQRRHKSGHQHHHNHATASGHRSTAQRPKCADSSEPGGSGGRIVEEEDTRIADTNTDAEEVITMETLVVDPSGLPTAAATIANAAEGKSAPSSSATTAAARADGGDEANPPGNSINPKSHRKSRRHRHRSSPHERRRDKRKSDGGMASVATLDDDDRHPSFIGSRSLEASDDYRRFQKRLRQAGTLVSDERRLLRETVKEQYNFFGDLDRDDLLGAPYAFLTNYYLPLPIQDRQRLVELFYDADESVFRYFFGGRLNRFEDLTEPKWGGGAGNALRSLFFSFWGGDGGVEAAGRQELCEVLQAWSDAGVREASLRRQWENIRNVCVSITSMYRGKGGAYIPPHVPLRSAVQQCFSLPLPLALRYTTAVFSYEHNLTCRFTERLHSFEEHSALCEVIGACWCDATQLFLREDLLAGCRRLCRMLEDARVMAELHPLLFGEPLRARWQLQLDEVQRAIGTDKLNGSPVFSVLVDPGTSAAAAAMATSAASTTWDAAELERSRAMSATPPPQQITTPATAAHASSSSPIGVAPLAGGGTAGAAGASTGNPVAASNTTTGLCGNRLYSRRFVFEFPSLMKSLSKACAHLSNASGSGVGDTVEVFYRVFAHLEAIGARTGGGGGGAAGLSATAAGAASTMSATGAAQVNPAAVASAPTEYLASSLQVDTSETGRLSAVANASNTSSNSLQSPLQQQLQQQQQRQRSLQQTTSETGGASQPPLAPARLAKSASVPQFGQSGRPSAAGVQMPLLRKNARSEEMLASLDINSVWAAEPALNSINLDGITNGSIIISGSFSFLPQVAAAADGLTSPLGASLLPPTSSADAMVEPPRAPASAVAGGSPSAAPGYGAAPFSISSASGAASAAAAGVAATSTIAAVAAGPAMRKKVSDRRYVRELCLFLNHLPRAWALLTCLTPEELAVSNQAMGPFVMVFKVIVQILLAADDFH